jgi:hypothetical protein
MYSVIKFTGFYVFLFCTFSTLCYSDFGCVDSAIQCLESVQFGALPCSFGRIGTLDGKKFKSTNMNDVLAQVMLEMSSVQISVSRFPRYCTQNI